MVNGRAPSGSYAAASAREAKETICDLIAAAGGVLHGKVRLHKAFYFAHLFYFGDGKGILTDHPIVRLPQGPFIDHGERLIDELRREGVLTIASAPVGPFQETVYKLEAPRAVDPETARGRAILRAVELVANRSAAELSELTHEHSISWQNTENGREMDIYLDLLSDDVLATMRREIAELRGGEV
ncbi:MAG TPA: hypothetical protein VFJ16_05930 [Longimicrobium sp.]|nr:hypothetical protein [Longimicrobium sp.]